MTFRPFTTREVAEAVRAATGSVQAHSPSSIKLAQKCRHAWALCYLDGIREPEVTWDDIASGRVEPRGGQRSKAIGTQVHTWAEAWLVRPVTPAELARATLAVASRLSRGTSLAVQGTRTSVSVIDWESAPGRVLEALIPLLPPKGSVAPEHIETRIDLVVDGVKFKGYADMMFATDAATAAGLRPVVYDHKTTRDIAKYALLPDAVAQTLPKPPPRAGLHPRIRESLERVDGDRSLKNDLQACVYALASVRRHRDSAKGSSHVPRRVTPGTPSVVCKWNYGETDATRLRKGQTVRSLPVVQVIEADHAEAVVRDAAAFAKTLAQYTTSDEAPKNPLACGDYGGCWYRSEGHCKTPRPYGTLIRIEEIRAQEKAHMAAAKSFKDLVAANKAAGAKPAPAKTAPAKAASKAKPAPVEEEQEEETPADEGVEGEADLSALVAQVAALLPSGTTITIAAAG
jgi:hypothetical protein